MDKSDNTVHNVDDGQISRSSSWMYTVGYQRAELGSHALLGLPNPDIAGGSCLVGLLSPDGIHFPHHGNLFHLFAQYV